jgi:hypothetical protein
LLGRGGAGVPSGDRDAGVEFIAATLHGGPEKGIRERGVGLDPQTRFGRHRALIDPEGGGDPEAPGLLRQTAAVLLDREMDHPLTVQIRQAIESDADARVADLHVWRVGRQHHAAIVCVVAAEPLSPADYRERLAGYTSLVHVSVEVNRSPGAADTAV